MDTYIGVVIVTYNAINAVKVTLESLALSKNKAKFKLLLVDNGSATDCFSSLKACFDSYIKRGHDWTLERSEKNLGFAGGNNIGIRKFLSDQSVSHICLLNSDVIVSDFWLDRLLDHHVDIISPVTNRADSEQCVPVDYSFNLSQNCAYGELSPKVFETVNAFSQEWYKAWKGNRVAGEATFFCVLIKTEVWQTVGLLDEVFFPGGFEDDDYCIRARKKEFSVVIARDVFMHHWGSASFGLISYSSFSKTYNKNKKYLEKKHSYTWKRRHEKPFLSYWQDLSFELNSGNGSKIRRYFIDLYNLQLTKVLKKLLAEFSDLKSSVLVNKLDGLTELQEISKVDVDQIFRTWLQIENISKNYRSIDFDRIKNSFDNILFWVHKIGEYNLLMSELLFDDKKKSFVWMQKFSLRKIYRAVCFLLKFDGIVFFGGYPFKAREHDGYYQRIKSIDTLFADRWRVYVDSDEPIAEYNTFMQRPGEKVVVLRNVFGRRLIRIFFRLIVLGLVVRCRRIYFHSVLQMAKGWAGQFIRIPGVYSVIDIHGVVPEEFRYHGDFASGRFYDQLEAFAVKRCNLLIVVSNPMEKYLRQKYKGDLRGKILNLPILPFISGRRSRISNTVPTVVYAGGLHKWQQVPKMLKAIQATKAHYKFKFYCPDVEIIRNELKHRYNITDIEVCRKAHSEVIDSYAECDFGFLLREDVVVNQVACPTKLVEYIATGVIPIVEYTNIGGFAELGLKSIKFEDFLEGKIPSDSERDEYIKKNFDIYTNLISLVRYNSARLRYNVFLSNFTHFKKLVPVRSLPEVLDSFEDCDVLVQVDNFLSGGLENVVLGLNQALTNSGLKVEILVLGEHNSSIEKLKKTVARVHTFKYTDRDYYSLVRKIKPKVVLAHYSFRGFDLCSLFGIPVIQVIHNVYMWFSNEEREQFLFATIFTTKFVAVSDFAREYCVKRLDVPASKCMVIPNGIVTENINYCGDKRKVLRSRYGFSGEEFVFLSVGAINHQKNHLSTVKSFLAASKYNTKIRLVIAGPNYEPSILDSIERFTHEHNIAEKVKYIGISEHVSDLYAMADCLVHNAFFEGGPLVMLEAFVANLPIIATETGIARGFANSPGVILIPPHVDILSYEGGIAQLSSSPEVESILTRAMVEASLGSIKPERSSELFVSMDSKNTYAAYVSLVNQQIKARLKMQTENESLGEIQGVGLSVAGE